MSPAWQKAWKVEKSNFLALSEIEAQPDNFFTCLNGNSENKIAKPIKNYLDLFNNTSLNHMSIRSRLVNHPKNKSILNSE